MTSQLNNLIKQSESVKSMNLYAALDLYDSLEFERAKFYNFDEKTGISRPKNGMTDVPVIQALTSAMDVVGEYTRNIVGPV